MSKHAPQPAELYFLPGMVGFVMGFVMCWLIVNLVRPVRISEPSDSIPEATTAATLDAVTATTAGQEAD